MTRRLSVPCHIRWELNEQSSVGYGTVLSAITKQGQLLRSFTCNCILAT